MTNLGVYAGAFAIGFVGSMPLAGPIAIMVVSRAASRRFGEALQIGLGASAAEGIYAGVAFWGFTSLFAGHPLLVPISRGITAVLLVALGTRFAFWSPNQDLRRAATSQDGERRSGKALLGFMLAAINPTFLVTWGAIVTFLYSKGLMHGSPAAGVLFGTCAGMGVGAWNVVLVALLRKYEGKLPDNVLRWTVRGLGIILVVLGVWSGVRVCMSMRGGRDTLPRVTASLPLEREMRTIDTRRVSLSLLVDRNHYDHVTLALAKARTSVWIATANVKQVLIEAPIGTRDRARGRFVPILDTIQSLCDRGVNVRLLHASPPSRPFREELARRSARLAAPRFQMRACPRVHLKIIAIDGALLYLGSANFTGAGLGAKGDGRRNFEMGVLTDDEWMLDEAQARFDSIWRGAECGACRLRSTCPKPLDVSSSSSREGRRM